MNYFVENKFRGEFVFVLEGKRLEEIKEEKREIWVNLFIEEYILKYMNDGINKKEVIKFVVKERELFKNEVYKFLINI